MTKGANIPITDAKSAGQDIDKGITSGAKDAEQGVDKVVRQINDDLDTIKSASTKAGDGISSGVTKGAHEASEGMDEIKESAKQNAIETAASFDGSAQSIASGFQGAAAEAFAGFGPAGVVAGLAAAAGVGLVSKALGKAKEDAQATAEEVASVAGELIDLGRTSRGPEQVRDALQDMATTADDGKVKLDEVAKKAKSAGINFKDYAQGLAGDNTAAARSFAQINAALEDQAEHYDALAGDSGAQTTYYASIKAQNDALESARSELLKTDATLDRASQTTKEFATATDGLSQSQEAYGEALAGLAAPSDLYSEAMDAAKASAEATATAAGKSADDIAKAGDDAVATLDDVLARLADEVRKRKDFEANLANLAQRGWGALADELRAGGPEANGAVVDLLASGTDQQVQQYATDSGSLLGQNLAKGAASGVTAQKSAFQQAITGAVGSVSVPGITIPVTADPSSFKATVKALVDGSYRITVGSQVGRAYQ